MNDDQARAAVTAALHQVAPEADLAALDPDADIREELDIDSMDLLNFAIEIERLTGVDIPERDYPQMTTVNTSIAYLVAHGQAAARAGDQEGAQVAVDAEGRAP